MLLSTCNALFMLFFMLIDTISTQADVQFILLRERKQYSCDSSHLIDTCETYCKGVPYICKGRACYCHHSVTLVDTIPKEKTVPFISLRSDDRIEYPEKPALRHHIAHFCENLDKARECIRKCMTQGKPAFCGKDHSCYCGHKYTSHDINRVKNPEETYGQFKDMYDKYFGNSGQ